MVGDEHWNESAEKAFLFGLILFIIVAPIATLVTFYITEPNFRIMVDKIIHNSN